MKRAIIGIVAVFSVTCSALLWRSHAQVIGHMRDGSVVTMRDEGFFKLGAAMAVLELKRHPEILNDENRALTLADNLWAKAHPELNATNSPTKP